MHRKFKRIGLMGRQRSSKSLQSLKDVLHYLTQDNYQIFVEAETAAMLDDASIEGIARDEFGKNCDLVIVVGGDGSLLNAARAIVDFETPVVGINRGRVGFLTDISPQEINSRLSEVLAGNYIEEKRFLLHAEIFHEDTCIYQDIALNDVVLLPGDYAHMIEFEIYIDRQLVCSQRADGQIIATPTGSTAYALSGGGPILYPSLDAIVLVPMFSHTLSSRPIVVDGNKIIELRVAIDNETSPRISADGQTRIPIAPGDNLKIHKKKESLILLHPKDYNYFETLRTKLLWQTKL